MTLLSASDASLVYVNVKADFGARGDGKTSDLQAYRAAFAYCKSMRKKLFIPRGTYVLNGEVLASGYIGILGDEGATIVNGCFTVPYGIDITGVAFEGGYVSSATTSFVDQHFPHQIVFTPGRDDVPVSIRNNTFLNCDRAIAGAVLSGSYNRFFLSRIDISGNTFKRVKIKAVTVYVNGNINITRNSFIACGNTEGTSFELIQVGDTSNAYGTIVRPDKATIQHNEFYRTLTKPNATQGSYSLMQRQISVMAENAVIQGNVFTEDRGATHWHSLCSVYGKMKKGIIAHNAINTWNNIFHAILIKSDDNDVSKTYDDIRIHDNIITGTYGKGIDTYRSCHIYNNYIKLTKGVVGIHHHQDQAGPDSNRIISIHDNTVFLTPELLAVTADPTKDEEVYNEDDPHAFLISHSQDRFYFYNNTLILDMGNGIRTGGLKISNPSGTNSSSYHIYNNCLTVLNNSNEMISGMSVYHVNDAFIENNVFSGKWYYVISAFSTISNQFIVNHNTINDYVSRFISGSNCPVTKAVISKNMINGSSHCISGMIGSELIVNDNYISLLNSGRVVIYQNDAAVQKAMNNQIKLGSLVENRTTAITVISVNNLLENTSYTYRVNATGSQVNSFNNVILQRSNNYIAASILSNHDYGLE